MTGLIPTCAPTVCSIEVPGNSDRCCCCSYSCTMWWGRAAEAPARRAWSPARWLIWGTNTSRFPPSMNLTWSTRTRRTFRVYSGWVSSLLCRYWRRWADCVESFINLHIEEVIWNIKKALEQQRRCKWTKKVTPFLLHCYFWWWSAMFCLAWFLLYFIRGYFHPLWAVVLICSQCDKLNNNKQTERSMIRMVDCWTWCVAGGGWVHASSCTPHPGTPLGRLRIRQEQMDRSPQWATQSAKETPAGW